MENQLEVIVKESGLENTKAQIILKQFQDYFQVAAEWEKRARDIVVTDERQKVDMQMARTGRLFLREKRIAIEKTRKELKEQALREGKAIDGIANILKALYVPIEEYLGKQEKFVEIRAAEKAERLRIETEKKAEEERIAREKAEAEAQERMRLENERLKVEAFKREEAMRIEREEAEIKAREAREKADREKWEIQEKARKERLKQEEELIIEKMKARAEQEEIKRKNQIEQKRVEAARRKAEAELQRKKDAEEKLRIEEEERVEAMKKASDKKKLQKLAQDIWDIELPDVKSEKAKNTVNKVEVLLVQAAGIIMANTKEGRQ